MQCFTSDSCSSFWILKPKALVPHELLINAELTGHITILISAEISSSFISSNEFVPLKLEFLSLGTYWGGKVKERDALDSLKIKTWDLELEGTY